MFKSKYTPKMGAGSKGTAKGGAGKSAAPGQGFFAQRPVRRASLVSPWGVGAMVDFPGDESLMTAGLDAWPFPLEPCPPDWIVTEERLQQRLGVDHFRLPPDFRTPGAGVQNALKKVPFVRFPQWHSCPRCGNLRRLTLFGGTQRCDGPNWAEGLSCAQTVDKKRPRLLPVRFVAICSMKGHIQDFPFMEWVHRGSSPGPGCRLRLRAGRSSAGLSGIKIQCSCGQSASMAGAFNEGALDKVAGCCGQRPQLGEMPELRGTDLEGIENTGGGAPTSCGHSLRVVQRGASNTYFPHVASSIYLPLWGENVRRPVVEALENPDIWQALTDGLVDGKIDLERCKFFCSFNKWRGLDPTELCEAAQRRLDGKPSASDSPAPTGVTLDRHAEQEQFRFDEYEAMRTGKTVQPELEMSRFEGASYENPVRDFFSTVTLVRKLRETRALYGFSRYLPDDGRPIEQHISDLRLNPAINWLPAVVTRGEGIFFEVSDEAMQAWLHRADSETRAKELIGNMAKARAQRKQPGRELSPPFVMLHTLAHLIINQLAFDCGYGSSSLRERIYCDAAFPSRKMQGFLIYTASGDAEGTMGGLVRQGKPGSIEKTLDAALRRAQWCSYDPVCMESPGQGPDNCNRAACHGCAILPETSCEEGNRLLDRATVVGLPDHPEVGLFGPYLSESQEE